MIECAAILAGGKGTRLAAVAGDVPKALVPVGGKPVLGHQLDLLGKQSFRDVRILAGHLADQLVDFVGEQRPPGLTIRVEIEHELRGSAGAVIDRLDSLPEHFAVVYGDTMMAVDLRRMAEVHERRGADVTALVHPNDHPYDSDLVEVDADGWITALRPYPHPADACYRNLVSAALYMVRRDSLCRFAEQGPRKRDFAKDVFPSLLESGGHLLAYSSSEYIKDMGTPERLERVERDWQAGRIRPGSAEIPRPTVFLDRDGTLNWVNGHVARPDQLELLPGAAEALRLLRAAGYRLIVLTNQPVLARGEASDEDLEAIHRKLEWELGKGGAYLDAIYHCPHHPDAGFPGERAELKGECACRKPAPGLLDQAAADFAIALERSWMIGDTTRDLELARRAGIRSILVETGEGGKDGRFPDANPDHVARDLLAAAEWLVGATQCGVRSLPPHRIVAG